MPNLTVSRILVPVDFSPRAGEAVQYAKRLAAHFHSELLFLHVVEPVHLDYAMVEPLQHSVDALAEARRSGAMRMLEQFAQTGPPVPTVRNLVAEGEAADQILRTARTEGASLVVMPTRGRSRLRRFLIGSVTAKVLHDAEIPVVTGCHLEETDDFPDLQVRSVLCAVDLGTQSAPVLQWGARLAQEFKSTLTVVHVPENVGELTGEQKDCLELRLNKLVSTAGAEAKILVQPGDPSKAIAAAAEQCRADLVVIGRGAANSHLGRLRAQGYGIVRQSPCPVFSV